MSGMHLTKLTPKTVPGRLYAYLRQHPGWHDALTLAQDVAQTTRLSTHISAIRNELQRVGAPETVEHRNRRCVHGQRNYYRVVGV